MLEYSIGRALSRGISMTLPAGTLVVARQDQGGLARTYVAAGTQGVVTSGGSWPLQVRWDGLNFSQAAYRDDVL